MSDFNLDKKNEIIDDELNLGSIKNVIDYVLSAFEVPEEPIQRLPKLLNLTGSNLRPGISASEIASEIISKQVEAGRVIGDAFGDGPNVEEQMEIIRVQVILDHIFNKSVVNIEIPAGTKVVTTGIGNLGAPVVSNGYTTTITSCNGIIR